MHASYRVVGGAKINGRMTPSGNKNEVLPIIAASLLTKEEVEINYIPNISDVEVQFDILRKIGANVTYDREKRSAVIISDKITTHELDRKSVSKTRGSVLFLGALVGRMKKALIWTPGGDKIGKRPMDSYLHALEKLGAEVIVNGSSYSVEAQELVGTTIWQSEKAVTGTENLIMASVLAKGQTKIINAASEPHVQGLCKFLVSMGAIIDGIGTDTLVITGVSSLSGTSYTIGFDFMEAATFAVAAGITGGELTIDNIDGFQMTMIMNEFAKLGLDSKIYEDSVFIPGQSNLKISNYFDGSMNKLECMPWPGFPPDVLQFATILATQSEGKILIHDKMYEGRSFYTSELVSMGAEIFMADPHRIVVTGRKALKGRRLKSPDIRAGMSLLLAALVADGKSIIERGEIIERGYENIEEKFRNLGADITRIIH